MYYKCNFQDTCDIAGDQCNHQINNPISFLLWLDTYIASYRSAFHKK